MRESANETIGKEDSIARRSVIGDICSTAFEKLADQIIRYEGSVIFAIRQI